MRDETHPVYKYPYDAIENFDGVVEDRSCTGFISFGIFLLSWAAIIYFIYLGY